VRVRPPWCFKVVCLARQMHGRANQLAQRILYSRASWRLRERASSFRESVGEAAFEEAVGKKQRETKRFMHSFLSIAVSCMYCCI
jgi:hypothetical protein